MTLLIVDDEKTICDGLRALVERLALPQIDRIRTAYRSDDAIQIAQEESAQILITDIRMPGRTGLELLVELRRRLPGIRGIIVTGHDDFEFVRQALRLETVDYLLKPATRDELKNAIERAIREIENDAASQVLQIDTRMRYFDSLVDVSWPWLAEGAHLTAETIHYLEQTLQNRIGLEVFELFAFEHETDHPLDIARLMLEGATSEAENVLWRLRDESSAIVAIVASPTLATAKAVAERVSSRVPDHDGLHLSFSGTRKGLGSLPSLYAVLTVARASKIADESYVHRVDENAAPQSYESWVQTEALRMVVSVVEDDPADESDRTQATVASLSTAASIPVRLLALWDELERNARLVTGRASLRFPAITGFFTARAAVVAAHRTVRESITPETDSSHVAIRQARRFVEHHFHEQHTMQDVADRLGMSYAYFSTLFKTHTGETYSHYLTRTRMERARGLMDEVRLPVADVASQVGYQYPKHFTRAFKRYWGVTPQHYMSGEREQPLSVANPADDLPEGESLAGHEDSDSEDPGSEKRDTHD